MTPDASDKSSFASVIELISLAFQHKESVLGSRLSIFEPEDLYSFEYEKFISGGLHHLSKSYFNSLVLYHSAVFDIAKRRLRMCEKNANKQYDMDFTTAHKIMGKPVRSLKFSNLEHLQLLQQFLCFNDYVHLMPVPLQQVLKRITPFKRLSWIVALLINFHHVNECCSSVSLALKFCLKAIKLSFSIIPPAKRYGLHYNDIISHRLTEFLQIIRIAQCDKYLVSEALRVYPLNPDMDEIFFLRARHLKYVIEAVQDTESKVIKLFQNQNPGQLSSFDRCFSLGMNQNLVTLIEFGIVSNLSAKDWVVMKWSGMNCHDNFLMNDKALLPVFGRFRLRLHQTLVLFMLSVSNKENRIRAEFLLKLIWASIPDPLLTEDEIRECLEETVQKIELFSEIALKQVVYHTVKDSPDTEFSKSLHEETCYKMAKYSVQKETIPSLIGTQSAETALEAWQWYKETLLMGRSNLKSPRSLKHLSRYCIRQNLSLNFQLPRGVQGLNLPQSVTNYLLLKDCGNNPYEEKLEENILVK